ncbi:MAG: 50S ribosomal protein L9 [Candidatus Hatepunaea meridiana]|nr:50S ribosomal protein L9 [Candidatus Hatepunaea meridiana]
MKIVLLTDVEKLGQSSDMVTVKDGYARNFLIPTGMAVKANPSNLKQLEAQRKIAKSRALRELKTHKSMATRLANCTLTAKLQTGEEDKVFGAVTSANIAELLAEQNIEIDRRIINLPEPIKALGVYTVPIKLHADVEAHIKVNIIKED